MRKRGSVGATAAKGEWPDKSWPRIVALVSITVASFVLILAAYGRATSDATIQLHARERILARQAVIGISDYFDYHAGLLRFLGSMPEVRDMTEEGKSTLRSFFRANEATVASVTRVDERGNMVYTYPYETTALVS
ncbi:MAG: hypothetical protein Q8M76_02225, partial [Spirochaetaceae bacterium]|nr:hypothetical protein [Spirochaetaceae bacterium]